MHKHVREWGEHSDWSENSIDETVTDISNEIDKPDHKENTEQCPIEKAYNLRQQRKKLFQAELFGDPAWDILLDLYVSGQAGKNISITSACIAGGVPASTGLRWIAILIQNGYVERHDDPVDARRSFVSLTPVARAKLEILFGKTSEAA